MALSKDNVAKAWDILHSINPNATNSFLFGIEDERDPDVKKENVIIGFGKKYDDGWENVFMNVRSITSEQIQIFEQRKKEVHNSSFIEPLEGELTRIGWF